ncbi:MAG TPA: protein kinase [Polyangiaceae bacterium]|nr:protein kinase [Polyangiaceae bacterium]
MQLGTLIAERFELEQRAGSGGTGAVFRAFDRTTQSRVALKLLHATVPEQVQRFQREAQLLADIEHPGVVRYVAHGVTEGQPYLVMEWLEGEDLSSRLERGPLPISDAIAILTQVAGAMAIAHQRGIVHRDIKPANLWLTDGDAHRAVVLDLGLARPVSRPKLALSVTGAVMGTPGYMAPEQARGSPDLDVRADVFSLGCVLYECLTGKPAFDGEHVTAILAKILFEDAPRVSSLREDVPPALEQLVHLMLARKAAERPADAGAVVEALANIERRAGRDATQRNSMLTRPTSLTYREQRVLCVLIADRATARSGLTLTLADDARPESAALRAIAEQHGGRLELLVNGCAIATFSSAGHAPDLLAQAARCALALRPMLPGLCFALATGRALFAEALPVGEAVETAARYLTRTEPGEIRLDDVSIGLLNARFRVEGGCLTGEQELPSGNRLLLGKQTACVGREWELKTLETALAECIEACSPRVALVTAPAGLGKSRLRHEFLRRLDAPDAEVWMASGDPMRAGAPLGLLAQATRSSFGIHGGVPVALQRKTIRARVEHAIEPREAARVAEFLGELIGAPFPGENSVALQAARRDAMLMGDQMLHAWEDWLDAESQQDPVILIFEDVHWGDLPTVKFVDAALRKLNDRAIFVLALGRPEIHEKFPRLWAERGAVEINLRQLTRKACAQLVRQVLGEKPSSELVDRVVERAEGNAFYLEELIRTVAEGSDDLPSSLITMLQFRLAALSDELRLILRAASVFGGAFHGGAVALMLGGSPPSALQASLEELVEREWIGKGRESRFAGEVSYTFRHDLVREAAYATLTEGDRVLAHRLAADWLERAGETEAIVVAEHCKRGGDLTRAVRWYQRAAEQALESNDLEAAIARAERAADSGAVEGTLGALRVLQAEAHNWRAEWSEGERRGLQAMALLPAGSPLWGHALHQAFWAGIALGKSDEIEVLVDQLLANASKPLDRLHAIAHANIAQHLLLLNKKERALTVIESLTTNPPLDSDPVVEGSSAQAFARRELMVGNTAQALSFYTDALAHLQVAGDARQVCMAQVNRGWLLAQLGQYTESQNVLRQSAAAAKRLGLHGVGANALVELGFALANLGRHREAIAIAREGIEALSANEYAAQAGQARIYISRFLYMVGDFPAAEREARAALGQTSDIPTFRAKALASLAQALTVLGNHRDALVAASQALEVLDAVAGVDDWDAFVRLVHAEAVQAAGDTENARLLLRGARDRLLERAARIDSLALRQSFLEQVPENSRTLQLAASDAAE